MTAPHSTAFPPIPRSPREHHISESNALLHISVLLSSNSVSLPYIMLSRTCTLPAVIYCSNTKPTSCNHHHAGHGRRQPQQHLHACAHTCAIVIQVRFLVFVWLYSLSPPVQSMPLVSENRSHSSVRLLI